jgi:hypothetical protein
LDPFISYKENEVLSIQSQVFTNLYNFPEAPSIINENSKNMLFNSMSLSMAHHDTPDV